MPSQPSLIEMLAMSCACVGRRVVRLVTEVPHGSTPFLTTTELLY